MAPAARRLALPLLTLLLAAPLAAQEANRNIRFGMPGPAKADPAARENYLIARPQYVLSYNAKTHAPNWVCWQLKKDDIGSASRGPFSPDPLLPPGFAKVTSNVYTGSGFDRGHQCPAKDRSATQKDCDATFYMTNVVPQSPHSNQRGWERLEDYCRRLVKEGHVLYIACGPHGVGGTGKNGRADEIGKGRLKVSVPAKLWKVIMVLPREDAKPRKNTRVIAIIMPNNQSVDYDWAKYRVAVKDVERLTGLKFFPEIDAEVAAAIKASPDDVKVRVPRPRRDGGKSAAGRSDDREEGAVAKKGKGKGDEVLDALKKASKGLLFTSETDAPLEPFAWEGGPDKLSKKDVLKLADEEEDAEVEEQGLDEFFRVVPPEDKAKFDELAKVLKEHLSGIKVYKVGDEAEKTAYIVGRTKDGRWAGLKTTVVET